MQKSDLDGRAMTRQILAEQAAAWAPIYQAALDMQGRNPDLLALAEQCPTDGPEGARRLIPLLAMAQHPQVLRSCVAWCEFAAGELARDDDDDEPPGIVVRGRRDDPDVTDGEETGCQQMHDRLAELERQLREVKALLTRVLDLYDEEDGPRSQPQSS